MMDDAFRADEVDFLSNLFLDDKDPFCVKSWYELDERFCFVSGRKRRYQIAWQSSIGVQFLSSVKSPRAVFAHDQLLAIVKEYDFLRYESLVHNIYKGCSGVLPV